MTTWPETPLHDHPWPEPDCAECQSLATTRIPERPKEGTMSTSRSAVTVICDECRGYLNTTRTTTAGARGDAARRGWRTATYGDGYHAAGESSDHAARDICPDCRPDKPNVDVGLFTTRPEGA